MSILRNLLAAAVVAVSTPVFAGAGSWTDTANEPAIFQTNWYYGPVTIEALSGVPATALNLNTTVQWGYAASTFPQDPAYTLRARICVLGTNGKCGEQSSNNKTGLSDSNDTFWANTSATANWTFEAKAVSTVQKVFVSSLSPSRTVLIGVNYTY